MTVGEVTRAIHSGELDVDLQQILVAARQRELLLKRLASSQLTPGDRARIGMTCRPMYLRGLDVTITSIDRDKARVRFDYPALARGFARDCRIPMTLLEPIG